MTVQDVMTSPVHRVKPDMKVYEAVELLTRYKISGAPIVDQNDNVISIISEGDLLRLAATEGLETTIAHCLPKLPSIQQLITLKKDQLFADAYKLFLKHSLHRIAVVDGNGRLNGIVSRADVLRIFVEAHHGRKLNQSKS